MNELLSNTNDTETIIDPKLFGLPRPLVGAVIGVLVFLVLSSIAQGIEADLASAALLSPGYLTILILSVTGLGAFVLILGGNAILFSVSSIPPAIIGSLVISKKKETRRNGFILLGMYFIISMLAGFFSMLASSLFE